MPGLTNLAILDLGCGTGLSGAAFKDLAARLDGIDLSPAMIEKARGAASTILLPSPISKAGSTQAQGAYDLLLAADTLVYLGDLGVDNARRGAARSKPGVFFLFTVEKKEGEGFELGPKRRWRHSDIYIRRLAREHGFEIAGLLGLHATHGSQHAGGRVCRGITQAPLSNIARTLQRSRHGTQHRHFNFRRRRRTRLCRAVGSFHDGQ